MTAADDELKKALERIEELETQIANQEWLLTKRTEAWQVVHATTRKLNKNSLREARIQGARSALRWFTNQKIVTLAGVGGARARFNEWEDTQ